MKQFNYIITDPEGIHARPAGEFVKAAKFDRMGSFTYSPEEGTPAATFDNQIDDETKRRRQEIIMTLQETVNEELIQRRLDTEMQVLVEGYDRLNKCYYGRTYADAPDIAAASDALHL